jgi:tripartite ATP-independent transporter DctP family solute receptor
VPPFIGSLEKVPEVRRRIPAQAKAGDQRGDSIVLTRGSFIYAAAVVAVTLLTSPAHTEPVVLRIGSSFGPEHSTSKAIEIFKTEVVRRTQGAVDVEYYPALKLGGPKDLLDGMRAGTVFATPSTPAYLSRTIPEIEVLDLPFVIKDLASARRVADGAIGKLIGARLTAKGFVMLGWMVLGSRHVTNAIRPVKTLDDLKGLRIRVQPSETHIATFRALGANPVMLDIKEVYTALRQGDIDAEENPYYPIYSNKFYEVQRYLSDTGHLFDLSQFIASQKIFSALSPEQQQAIRDAARIAVAEQWKLAPQVEADALADLKAHGMQFDPIPNATRVAMKKATAGVIANARQRIGAALVDQYVAMGGR